MAFLEKHIFHPKSYSSDDAYREIQNEYLMFSPNYECVCLLCDFNSRTETDDDFIFIDDDDPSTEGIDIVNSGSFLGMHSLPRKRNSRDKTRNNFGKLLLDFCKSNDFFILNGRLNGDVEGKCKGVSVVDYCLCNVNILSNFIRLDVLEFSKLYSDAHSPISVSIKVKEKTNNAAESCNQSNKEEVINK